MKVIFQNLFLRMNVVIKDKIIIFFNSCVFIIECQKGTIK